MKEEIEATVSQLPLQENDAVLSYIHYFSTDRGRKVLVAGLRRSGRYRPLIQRILDDEGVPRGIDLSGASGIGLPAARPFEQKSRRHVAVRSVSRPGIRLDARPRHR